MAHASLFIQYPHYLSGSSFDLDEHHPFLMELHKHDANSEILLIEEGAGEFEIDGISYEAEAGTLLFYQRGVWHKERSTKHPFRATYIGFTGLMLRDLELDYFLDPHAVPFIQLQEQLPAFRKLMKDCIAEHQNAEPESEGIANHHLGILFAKLARMAYYRDFGDKSRTSAKEMIGAVKRRIEENYSSSLTLELLAEEAFINKFHLAHLFKDGVGKSPIQFLIYCRIEAAKRYLRTTNLQVKEIAELVGYQSEPSFYHMFMKVTGLTPRSYREER